MEQEDSKFTAGSFLTYVKENIRNYSMFLLLALIFIAFSILTGGVNFTARNITNIFIQNSYILILAVAWYRVIIIGNIDLPQSDPSPPSSGQSVPCSTTREWDCS